MKDKGIKEIFEKLFFAINHVDKVIQNYDLKTEENKKIIYDKGYGVELKALIRVVTELVENHQEIKSIHFKKNKKATD